MVCSAERLQVAALRGLALAYPESLGGWVLFRNIWKWANDAVAATGFQKLCQDFVAGGSSEPSPVC